MTELIMDPTGDNVELRAIVEQQRETIGQLTSVVELLVWQLLGLNQQRNNIRPLPVTEGDWFDDVKLP